MHRAPVRTGAGGGRRAVLLLAALLLLSGCSGLFLYPSKTLHWTPTILRLQYEDVYFETADGLRLHGWYLPAQGTAKGSVLHLHGNAENVADHLGFVAWLPPAGYNVLMWDYRGYGKSEGRASVMGAHADARDALRYMLARGGDDAQRLVMLGHSLGGAIALQVAATVPEARQLHAVVSEGAFSSYRRIAREKMAMIWGINLLRATLQYLFNDRYSPIYVIDRIAPKPLLLIHGDADVVVPFHHAERLQRASGGHAELWRVEGGAHTDAFSREQYRERFLQYLERVLPPRS